MSIIIIVMILKSLASLLERNHLLNLTGFLSNVVVSQERKSTERKKSKGITMHCLIPDLSSLKLSIVCFSRKGRQLMLIQSGNRSRNRCRSSGLRRGREINIQRKDMTPTETPTEKEITHHTHPVITGRPRIKRKRTHGRHTADTLDSFPSSIQTVQSFLVSFPFK